MIKVRRSSSLYKPRYGRWVVPWDYPLGLLPQCRVFPHLGLGLNPFLNPSLDWDCITIGTRHEHHIHPLVVELESHQAHKTVPRSFVAWVRTLDPSNHPWSLCEAFPPSWSSLLSSIHLQPSASRPFVWSRLPQGHVLYSLSQEHFPCSSWLRYTLFHVEYWSRCCGRLRTCQCD